MQSRKEVDSLHPLQMKARVWCKAKQPQDVPLQSRKTLQESHGQGCGMTDSWGIPHHSPKRVWKSQGSAQSCSNPSMPQPSADLLPWHPTLRCGAG